MSGFTRRALIMVGAVALFSVAGVAWAAWLSSGSGSGSATSTTSINSTISPATGASNLYPGATTTFTVTIDNPNPYPVTVTGISAGSSNATGAAGACIAGSVFSDALTPGANTIAPSGSGTYTLTAHMIANPDEACKSGTFTLPLSATLASAA